MGKQLHNIHWSSYRLLNKPVQVIQHVSCVGGLITFKLQIFQERLLVSGQVKTNPPLETLPLAKELKASHCPSTRFNSCPNLSSPSMLSAREPKILHCSFTRFFNSLILFLDALGMGRSQDRPIGQWTDQPVKGCFWRKRLF